MGTFVIIVVLALALIGMLYFGAVSSRSMSVALGHDNGQLLPCPQSPNCVSSQAPAGDSHYIEPIMDIDGTKWASLISFLDELDNTELQTSEDDYLHYTFSTPLMGFVDDVEFYHDQALGLIHVRSASRVGYGDGGTNRKRVEMIRAGL